MPGSISFEATPALPASPTYTTKFYRDYTVLISTTITSTDIINGTKLSLPMWVGQPTYAFDSSKVRSVEVYTDADADNLLSDLVPSIYLGTAAFPSTTDMLPNVAYVRLDGTTIKVQAKQSLGDCDIIVVTD